MCKLLKAYRISKKAHKGQKDKSGQPYINHPVYVAKRVKGNDAKIVALLHDTIEDTNVTYDYIKSVFGDKIAEAVKVLTKDKTISYEEYIASIKQNDLAKVVKIEDLKHNMDLTRLKTVTQEDLDRIEKYKYALKILN
ncbi:MAG TPA: HD domain-containing protein [Bacteroidales bacterium]|nr:HD domain-containing protein [Bacteroidales bacterium]HQC59923.1 HD domain-containing protein [Bacteroidales bacterium]